MQTRRFGKDQLGVCVLGIGTTWFGRQWPPDVQGYTYPSFQEVDGFLDKAYDTVSLNDGLLMIDTAPSYGASEEMVGRYFSLHGSVRAKTLLATKWGEEFDVVNGQASLEHSAIRLWQSVRRSVGLLGKIDVLYMHRSSVEALGDESLIAEMQKVREDFGIRYIGASFSEESILEGAIKKGLLGWADAVQFPAIFFLKRADLAAMLREQDISLVLNSPVRRGGGRSPEAVYGDLFGSDGFSVVLTGTRHHLDETISLASIQRT